MKKTATREQSVFDPRTIGIVKPAVIAKAQAALDDFAVAHAEYEEAWAMAWPVIKSAGHFRHMDQNETSQRAVTDMVTTASRTLIDAMGALHHLLDGEIGCTIHETWRDDRYKIESEPAVALASKYLESCGALAWLVGECEVPPIELREQLILRASIGLALLRTKSRDV